MRLATLVFLPLFSLSAQSPDAATLLKNIAAIPDGYRSVQYTSAMAMEMSVSGNPMKMNMSMVVSAAQGGKFRMETKGVMGADSTMVSDGASLWSYSPTTKQYTKTTGGAESAFRDAIDELGLAENAAKRPENAKVLRVETLEVDGQPHSCWVVEGRIEQLGVPEFPFKDVAYTVWIDQTLGIELKTTMSGKMQQDPLPQPVEMHMTTTKSGLKLNADLPDSLFEFTPPEGAREVKKLGGPDAAPEPAVAASKASPSAPPAEGEPQAFVPNLHPTREVEPDYPEAARSQGVQGSVRVLVTLDALGNVTDAEALSGNELLRKPADDAVRKYRFRPVMRNGKAVAAFTEASVFFYSSKLEKMDLDLAGEMAATQRVLELQSKFPRTPEQTLADLEQDLGDSKGLERYYALPQLAKAALSAGALDRAASYARELLGSRDPAQRDWNDGNAIHDGNMILGLVALRSGSIAQADKYLLEAGKTSGSPQLNSFGPDMTLASELLQKGERDTVLEYFALCRKFWSMGAARLDTWTAAVRGDKTPDFSMNLLMMR